MDILKILALFQIKNPPVAGTDIYPPEKVKDLKATPNRNNNAIVLSFTSPGDDYDEGIGKRSTLLNDQLLN